VYFRDAELLASIYFSLPVENSASEVIWRLHSRDSYWEVGKCGVVVAIVHYSRMTGWPEVIR
jgi:hypothetical protein